MATITLQGVSFSVYGDHAGSGSLTEYAIGSLAHTATYLAAGSDTQKAAMVTATRILESERWVGTKTDSGQTLAWPRTGVSDADGSALASDSIPSVIVRGFYELTLELLSDPALARALQDPTSNVASVSDGKVALTFRKPLTDGNRFPGLAQALLAPYLYSASAQAGLGASERLGNDDTAWRAGSSAFDDDDTYGLGI